MSVNNIDTCMDELVRDLRARQMAVFVGGGVSMCPPSYLPSWSALGAQVLDSVLLSLARRGVSLLCDSGIDQCLRKSSVGPETIFAALADHISEKAKSSIPPLLDGVPINSLHDLIAKLARLRLIRVIVTTNFDTLLEQALTMRGVPFVQVSDEEDFHDFLTCGLKLFRNPHFDTGAPLVKLPAMVLGTTDPNVGSEAKRRRERFDLPVVLIKLHGTIERPHKMLLTTTETAESLSDSRLLVFRFALCQYHFLYLGYSGKDLDIAPLITQSRTTYDTINKKTLTVWAPFDQRDEESMPDELFFVPELSARKAYWVVAPREVGKNSAITEILSTYGSNGIEIQCDLRDLSIELGRHMAELNAITSEIHVAQQPLHLNQASQALQQWADGTSASELLLSISELLRSQLQEVRLAEAVAEEAQLRALDIHEKLHILRVRLEISIEKREKVQSVDLLRQFTRTSNTLGTDAAIEARLYEGLVLLELGLHREAKKVFQDVASVSGALKLSTSTRDYVLRAWNGLAACEAKCRQFGNAITLLEYAKRLLEETRFDCGHAWTTARWSSLRTTIASNLAYCYGKMGDHESARNELQVALQAASAARQPDSQLLVLSRMIRASMEKDDIDAAALYMHKAAKLLERGVKPVATINIE